MPRSLWFCITICTAVLCILTVLIICEVPVPGDMAMVNWAVSRRNEPFTVFIEGLTFVSSAIPGLIITGVVSLVELWRRKRFDLRAGWATMAYLGAVACNIGLRILVGRQRPSVSYIPHVLPELQMGFQRFCYPSGHAGTALVAFSSLIVLAWALPRLRWVALAAGVLVILCCGYGRVYMGVHWPTDVLAGYLLGTSWLAIGLLIRQYKNSGGIP
ncbi:MAG: phosphatase PAP2 family protein [Anaerolineae bacterium]|nr:phosphatase PAP2 family protein [Anaerolineae bacterium]